MTLGVTELVEVVRAGLAEDERIALAARRQVGRRWTLYLNDRGDGMVSHDGDTIARVDREPTVDDLMDGVLFAEVAEHMVRHDPQRVFAEIRAKRQLFDQALAWEHGFGWAGRCSGDPCLCDRHERVHAVLQALAAPYQEQP